MRQDRVPRRRGWAPTPRKPEARAASRAWPTTGVEAGALHADTLTKRDDRRRGWGPV